MKLVASTTKTSVGDKIRLRWHSKRADVVMASGDWGGSHKSKGWEDIRISERGKHIFKLTVKNASGIKTARVKVMASRKAKELELVVTDELSLVGAKVDVRADGLAKGEEFTSDSTASRSRPARPTRRAMSRGPSRWPRRPLPGRPAADHHGQQPETGSARAVLNVIRSQTTFDVFGGPRTKLPKGAEQTIDRRKG